MSLYTKYRSQTFDDLVEQDSVKQILKNQVLKINSGGSKLSNYIFFGPRGTGKTSVARIFAKAINCLNTTDGNPCNECVNCQLISQGKTLDVVEIDAASHTGVDNIREEIIAKAAYQPSTLRKKVYIIDEAHMLSKSAFNALLKIIEEPPEYLVFILATTDPQKILDTVKSRCQMFGFKNISMQGIVSWLKHVCELENIKYDDDGIQLIAKIANGGMRDALKYLDQVSGIGDITGPIVSQALGIAGDAAIIDFINAYQSDNISNIYTQIDNIVANGSDINNFLKDLGQYIDRNLTAENMSLYIPLIQTIKGYFETVRLYPFPSTVLKNQIYIYTGVESGKLKVESEYNGVQNNIQKRDILTSKESEPTSITETQNSQPESVQSKTISAPTQPTDNSTTLITTNSTVAPLSDISNTHNNLDLDFVRQSVIDKSSPVIKGIREKQCQIIKLENDVLYIGVISAGSITILNMKKSETEKLLIGITGKNLSIIYQNTNSEDLLGSILNFE